MMKENNIPNQVFIGCPWKAYRPKYEKLIEELNKKFPLSFVIVGRGDGQNAQDLLDKIKDKLFASSSAIFDASAGNANVSLEYGMAEVKEIPRAIYISKHKLSKDVNVDAAIISDLAGKTRNEYKQLNGLRRLLVQFAQTHSYTKRFETFFKKEYKRLGKGSKKSLRALTLKIIHILDQKDSVRRSDVVQELIGQGYEESVVNECIKKLHSARIARCTEGRYSDVSIG